MLIPTVEDGLESLVRQTLPLSLEVGDVSFEPPSGTWAAQVNRITVSFFLYGVTRSPMPPRAAAQRAGADGRIERRPALPLVQLSYLVSAWAGSTRDEHQLLGDVLTRLMAHQILPPEHLSTPLNSSVQLTLASDELNRPRDLWSALGGNLKASFTLLATVASDAFDWELAPRGVSSIEGMATPAPSGPPAGDPRPAPGSGHTTRREEGRLVRSSADEGEPDRPA